jgi:hypothetical protein
MVDGWHVWIRWVGVKRLSLNIIKLQHLIIILEWDYCRHSYNIGFFCLKRLHSLEVIGFIQTVVVNIILRIRVLLNRLMHANKLVIEVRLLLHQIFQSIRVHMEAAINLEVSILIMTLMPSIRFGSST